VRGRSGSFTCLFITATLFSHTAVKAQELGRWRCIVEDFKGFDEADLQFIERNMQKTFVMSVTDKDVILQMESAYFESEEQRFSFFKSDALGRYAMVDDTAGLDIFILPSSIAEEIESQGFFNAVVTFQISAIANSWLLRCVE
jgi:hypothetical protein